MTLDDTPGETHGELIRLLCVTAYALYSSNLVNVPAAIKRHNWFKNISPGNLVLEWTSASRGDSRLRIGEFVRVAWEPFHSDEEWEQVKADYEGRERPQERAWYIKLLHNRQEVRWTNCEFIRVPTSEREFWDIERSPTVSANEVSK